MTESCGNIATTGVEAEYAQDEDVADSPDIDMRDVYHTVLERVPYSRWRVMYVAGAMREELKRAKSGMDAGVLSRIPYYMLSAATLPLTFAVRYAGSFEYLGYNKGAQRYQLK